jgi:VanZ family protein
MKIYMQKLAIIVGSVFFLFIIWVIYLANTGQQSILFPLVKLIPYGDKIGHLVLFGLLALFANLATGFRIFCVGTKRVFCGTAAVFVFVTIEELSQHFLPHRTLDIYDYSADMLGILFFSWVSRRVARRNLTKQWAQL